MYFLNEVKKKSSNVILNYWINYNSILNYISKKKSMASAMQEIQVIFLLFFYMHSLVIYPIISLSRDMRRGVEYGLDGPHDDFKPTPSPIALFLFFN